jgi:DNA-binding GntR family transcriptional regulator
VKHAQVKSVLRLLRRHQHHQKRWEIRREREKKEPRHLGFSAGRRLIENLSPERIERLRQHCALELEARRREDKRLIVRLSGEFHTLMAELAGNQALARTMRELSTLTCLIIILYDAPTASSCLADEHSLIVDAIAKRDIEGGQRLMLEHLNHIEGSLNLEPADSAVDLAKIFSEE